MSLLSNSYGSNFDGIVWDEVHGAATLFEQVADDIKNICNAHIGTEPGEAMMIIPQQLQQYADMLQSIKHARMMYECSGTEIRVDVTVPNGKTCRITVTVVT